MNKDEIIYSFQFNFVILEHKGHDGLGLVWDILCWKNSINSELTKNLKEVLYDPGQCKYVKRFLDDMRLLSQNELIWIGSEDSYHQDFMGNNNIGLYHKFVKMITERNCSFIKVEVK